MKIKLQYLATKVAAWNSSNIFKALDIQRTLRVMQASFIRLAPHSQQTAFVKIFGPIDAKYLKHNIEHRCAEIRTTWIERTQRPFKPVSFEWDVSQESIRRTNHQIGIAGKKLSLPSLSDLRLSLPKNTSSGAPDFWTPKAEVLDDALYYVGQVLLGRILLPPVKYFWPVIVTWRSQMRASGEKTRVIHVFPHVVSVLEQFFAQPFFNLFQQLKGVTSYSFGCNWLDNRQFYIEMNNKYSQIVEIDYTTFDQSVKGFLMHIFYNNIKQHLDLNSPHLVKLFDWIADYHMHATILTSIDGTPTVIENKVNSVMSGSVFTNFIDSSINLFVLNYSIIKLGVGDYFIRVMGDDCIIADNEVEAEKMLSTIKTISEEVFGMQFGDTSQVRKLHYPIFYMGFLINEYMKYKPEELIKCKIMFTGRYIPEDELDNRLVVWSKFCSICSVSSNGYQFWLRYKDDLLGILEIDEPSYFHDLTEGPGKPFSTQRIIHNAKAYVREAWLYA